MNRKQRRQLQRSAAGRTAVAIQPAPAVTAPRWPLESSRIFIAGGVILIAICTWIIYGQTVHVAPIDYDDHFYLTVSPYVAVSSPLSRMSAPWTEPYFANWKQDYEEAVKNYQLTFLAPSGFTRGDVGILRRYSDASEALAQMDQAQLNEAGANRAALLGARDRLRSGSEEALERARKLLLADGVPPTDADYRMIVLQQGTIVFNREAGASVEEKAGDYQKALAHYQDAATLFPDDPRPLLDEGLCYERLAGLAQADEEMKHQVALGEAAVGKALTLSTTASDYNPATTYRVMASLYLHTGDYAAVLGWLQKARQATSDSADRAVIDKDIQNIEGYLRPGRK